MLTLEGCRIEQDDFTLEASFGVTAGRRIAVIGPSGAGKSTLLGAIAGFVPVARGAVLWRGEDITRAAPSARPVAILFQDNNLFPHLTIETNVALGLRQGRGTQEGRARVTGALDRVGLGGQAGSKPANLSGGQQSRAALARVLVQDRPLILLDEPFAALGPALRQEMLDLVATLATETGASLMMVTHAPEDVRRIAQDVIFVEGSVAQAPQPAAALMQNPPPALKAYLG